MILNLANPKESDISFEIIQFPDGEKHIRLAEFDRKKPYGVCTRICSMDDLFILMQVGDILDRAAVEWDLEIYYLMSMRMDRVMSFNEAFSLKIVANAINSLHYSRCFVYEPHSSRTLNLIRNCKNLEIPVENSYENEDVVYLFPDAGAADRYMDMFDFDTPIAYCTKVRDVATGKLLNFAFEDSKAIDDNPIIPIVVVDDLCDGGGTFIGIANLLKQNYPTRKRYIQVRHAVNPIGIQNMCNNYDEVYITNSYKEWGDDESIKQFANLHIERVI